MMLPRLAGLRRVHFVGVGGAGMSGIAEVLLQLEREWRREGMETQLEVSGSDLQTSETTARLEQLGLRFFAEHAEHNVAGADLVVVSSAVPPGNPEIVAGRRLGIPVIRRAEMLAELMRLKYGIAVAGTHGKTTTTSLIGTLLTATGLDPTVIVGGRLRVSGTGARLGKSDYLVAEADEFDRSFLSLTPVIAVITTVDRDHLDTYRDLADIEEAFVRFATSVPFFGQIIACCDDAGVRDILPRLAERRVVTVGLSAAADLRATDVELTREGSRFVIRRGDQQLGAVSLPLHGEHNVRNALAAIAVGLALGLDVPSMVEGLGSFAGVHRRFERLGLWRGATVVDDYAHHPTEIAATLRAASQVFSGARIHAVFQPHLYSRTRDLADEFGKSLLAASTALVTSVYASREAPLPGVSGELVVAAARRYGHPHVSYCEDWQQAPAQLLPRVHEGDAVLTLGAGDIHRLAERLAWGTT
jgi:UDP-N-acetylmuramate--alanine ligase